MSSQSITISNKRSLPLNTENGAVPHPASRNQDIGNVARELLLDLSFHLSDYPSAQHDLGAASENQARAKRWYEWAREKGYVISLFQLSHLAAQEGNQDEAQRLFQEALTLSPRLEGVAQYGAMFETSDRKAAIEIYRPGAMANHPFFQVKIALQLLKGDDTERNEGLAWLVSAALKQDPEAQYQMGLQFQKGVGVEKDLEKARIFFELAAKRGHAQAQYELAMCYERGHGVTLNLKEAVNWYRKAAFQNYSKALRKLGFGFKEIGALPELALSHYEKAAQLGDGLALLHLGDTYQKGNPHVLQDEKKAIDYHARAVTAFQNGIEQQDPEAMYGLSLCLRKGICIEKNDQKAFELCQMAAEQGLSIAQVELGHHYRDGIGVRKDDKEAFKWYQKGADQGDPYALEAVAECYERGAGVAKDERKAFEFCRNAARSEILSILYKEARYYELGIGTKENKRQAFSLYTELANRDFVLAQDALGRCYEHGIGVAQNRERSLHWYNKAASQGLITAQKNMGRLSDDLSSISMGTHMRLEWYKKAGSQGDAEAQCEVGDLYVKGGMGAPTNHKEAFIWYKRAADQGFARGEVSLAWCYLQGQGVESDPAKAFEWCQKAVKQGNPEAERVMGWFYENGIVKPKNVKEAFKWYSKAAHQGDPQAQAELGRCYEKGIGTLPSWEAAYEWYGKAAVNDHELGVFRLQSELSRELPKEAQPHQAKALFQFAESLKIKNSFSAAPSIYRKAAAKGHPEAQFVVGRDLFRRHPDEALDWVTKSARQGYLLAQRFLGKVYLSLDARRNFRLSAHWYAKAAAQGDGIARDRLGDIYLRGLGVERDPQMAIHWYEQAAAVHPFHGNFQLGQMYQQGEGVEKDLEMAQHYSNIFKEAARAHRARVAAGGEPIVEEESDLDFSDNDEDEDGEAIEGDVNLIEAAHPVNGAPQGNPAGGMDED